MYSSFRSRIFYLKANLQRVNHRHYVKKKQPKPKELTEDDIINKKGFQSWDKQALDQINGYSSLLRSSNHVEVPKYMYQRPQREEKKVFDLKINLEDSPFEINDKDDHYHINGTKIPQHLDHWIESPGGIKRARDHMILRKIEKMRQLSADKFKIKQQGGNQSDSQLLDKHKTTRRMMRYNNMIQDVLEKNLEELPALLMSRKIGQRHVTLSIADSINSSMLTFQRVEVSKDLRHAKIFWECKEGHHGIIERHIKRIQQVLRHQLAGNAHMKYAPEIHLVRDQLSIQGKAVRQAAYNIEDELLAYENRYDKNSTPPFMLHSDKPSKMDIRMINQEDNEDVFYKKRY